METVKHAYLFSGLGADSRIFEKLRFSDCNITYVEWILPQDKESIEHYASRLALQITEPRPVLIGLSFGGIIAVEIAKLIETDKVILISSVKSAKEIPFYYRWIGRAGFHKRIPPEFLNRNNFITNWLFGTVDAKERDMLKQFLGDTNPVFFKWALDQVVQWKNRAIPGNTFHIHGSGDRIFPIRFTNYDIRIPNGGHFMTLNRAGEINEILNDQIGR